MISRAAVGVLLVSAAGVATAFAIRLWFVAVSGPYAATSGFEEFCLYNIWKVAHGLPLYESPTREPFLLTSYNAGFYWMYAGWARLWQADGAGIVLASRVLTLVLTLVAWRLHVGLYRRVQAPRERSTRWFVVLSFVFWFGAAAGPWMPLTARPDIGAVACALAGLYVFLRAREAGSVGGLLVASLLFFAAWGQKQSVVWIFAGAVASLLRARSWRSAAALVAPFAVFAAVTIWVGGETYRYNLFVVPTIYRWLPGQSIFQLGRTVAMSPFTWVFGLVGLFATLRSVRLRPRSQLEVIAVSALAPIGMGIVQMAIHGAGPNNVLEGLAMLLLLGGVVFDRLLQSCPVSMSAKLGLAIASLLFVGSSAVSAMHIVQAFRSAPATEFRGWRVGNAIKLNRAQLAQRRVFAAWMQTLPQPIWIRDAMLQMPWFANANRYPAYVYNFEFQADASAKHIVDDGIFGLMRQRRFAALLLRPGDDDAWIREARRAGYVEQAIPAGFSPLATEYGLEEPAPRLFLRP